MTKWKVGDAVFLISGGPKMTVTSVDDEMAYCTWFDEKEQRHGSFPHAALKAPGSGSGQARTIR